MFWGLGFGTDPKHRILSLGCRGLPNLLQEDGSLSILQFVSKLKLPGSECKAFVVYAVRLRGLCQNSLYPQLRVHFFLSPRLMEKVWFQV